MKVSITGQESMTFKIQGDRLIEVTARGGLAVLCRHQQNHRFC